MADLSTTYNGVGNEREPDVDLGRICDGGVEVLGECYFGEWKEIAEPINTAIRAINQKSAETRDAVRVAYTAGTDRTQWLKDRIDAVDKRVDFIRGRVSVLLSYIQSINSDTAVVLEKGFTTALSALPYVGPVISLVEAGANSERQLEAAKAQLLIQQYTEDIKQLAAIRAALVAEYTKPPTTTFGTQPGATQTGNESPKPIPTYYYYLAGFGVLILLLLYWKNKKRR